jgi:hypothetical protein
MRKLGELSREAQRIATGCVRTNLDTPPNVLSEVLNLRPATIRTMKGNISRALGESFNNALERT